MVDTMEGANGGMAISRWHWAALLLYGLLCDIIYTAAAYTLCASTGSGDRARCDGGTATSLSRQPRPGLQRPGTSPRMRHYGGRCAGWRRRDYHRTRERDRDRRRVRRAAQWLQSPLGLEYLCIGDVPRAAFRMNLPHTDVVRVGDGKLPLQRGAPPPCISRRRASLIIAAMLLGVRVGEAQVPGPDDSFLDDSEPESVREAVGCLDPWGSQPQWPECDEWYLRDADNGVEIHDVGPPFSAAKTFCGARPGCAFKLGDRGLGYDRDDAGAHRGQGNCGPRVTLVLDGAVQREQGGAQGAARRNCGEADYDDVATIDADDSGNDGAEADGDGGAGASAMQTRGAQPHVRRKRGRRRCLRPYALGLGWRYFPQEGGAVGRGYGQSERVAGRREILGVVRC